MQENYSAEQMSMIYSALQTLLARILLEALRNWKGKHVKI